MVTDPVVTDPVVTDPVVTDPVVTDPVVTDPVVTDPVVTDPVVTDEAKKIDVLIPRIASADAPLLDGLGAVADSNGQLVGEWGAAVQTNVNGDPLLINHLMIDINANLPDLAPMRRWAAMHDDTYLYLLVLSDDVGRRYSDSAQPWQDDSTELFIDGDNSKLTSWGDNDDFQIIIPLLQRDTSDSNNHTDGRFAFGGGSSAAPLNLQFVTGPGVGPDGLRIAKWEQDVYEIKIDIASAGITVGSVFGIELQINDDDDGDTRDSKWGWKHPSRDGEDTDNTFLDPSYMGTAVLTN